MTTDHTKLTLDPSAPSEVDPSAPVKMVTVPRSLAFGGVVDMLLLRGELQTAGIAVFNSKATETHITLQIHDDVPDNDVKLVVAAHDVVRPRRMQAVDEKTVALIGKGFEHPVNSGQVFSLSAAAQHKGIALKFARDLLSYPFHIMQLDNLAPAVAFEDAAAIEALVDAGAAVIAQRVMSGVQLKEAIKAATTIEEVDAVVDDRE